MPLTFVYHKDSTHTHNTDLGEDVRLHRAHAQEGRHHRRVGRQLQGYVRAHAKAYIHTYYTYTPAPTTPNLIHPHPNANNTNTGKDQVVQYLLGDWLKKKCMANNVWWALNPGSDDTGGLLAVRFLLRFWALFVCAMVNVDVDVMCALLRFEGLLYYSFVCVVDVDVDVLRDVSSDMIYVYVCVLSTHPGPVKQKALVTRPDHPPPTHTFHPTK